MRSLDTSVAIDHLRGEPAARDLLEGLLADGEALVASEVVRFELLAGVRPGEAADTGRFLDALELVAVTGEVSRRAAGMAREYRGSHGGIDTADYLIAATALLLDAPLLTTNVRHFPMLEGLAPPY